MGQREEGGTEGGGWDRGRRVGQREEDGRGEDVKK